jgi:TIR domain
MGPQVLFNGQDIYDFVEIQQDKLNKAYEALPDDKALDEAFAVDLKRRFMLDVPRLRPGDWTYERRDITPHAIEIVAYIPFDGDPDVFKIRPSATKGTVAQGEIVDHDLLIRIRPMSGEFDVPAYVKREIAEIEWRLESLRGTMQHMNQQLEATIRFCIARRKRAVENKAKIGQNIGIPQRPKPIAPESTLEAKPIPVREQLISENPVREQWDIFMSHASPDKPYVEPLVEELKKAGVTVWYDKHVLGWGEGLRRGINKGLVNSRYAIVVLSKAFLAERKWTEHELNSLFAREAIGELVILPIWHGITRDDLLSYDPDLADRLAKISATDSYPDIVVSVLEKLDRLLLSSSRTANRANDAQPASAPLVISHAGLLIPHTTDGLVSYILYYTPDGKLAQMYVRKSPKGGDLYTLEEPGGTVHEGTRDQIADLYSFIDRSLLRDGYKPHLKNTSGEYPDFAG